MICVTHSFVQYLPPRFLDNYRAELPESIIFEIPNGEKTRVNYEQEDGVFNNVQRFVKNFKTKYGHCYIMTYKGDEIFLVNVLNEYMTEVEYDPPTYGKFSILSSKIVIYIYIYIYICWL
jgi:hypothetical protein